MTEGKEDDRVGRSAESDPQAPKPGFSTELTYDIIGAAQRVHRTLGMGFSESVYQAAMQKELMRRGLPFNSQQEFEVFYEGALCGTYRADLVVDNNVIVELKAASSIADEHKAQLVSYLKASGLPVGLVLNFGAPSLQVRRYLLKALK
jgi:GxxExxY protein